MRAVGWVDRANDPERIRAAVEGSRWIVTAWDGPKLVGFCRAFTDGTLTAYVNNVAVLPAYQRRGIGLELVRRLMAGHDRVAFVLHARQEIHPFYRALGFEPAPNMLRRPRRS